MSEYFITAKALSHQTPQGKVLANDLNFALGPGEVLLIKGPNGVGKTTLLHTLLQTHRFFSGSLSNSLSHGQIAYLPQLQNLSFHLPVTLQEVLEISVGRAVAASECLAFGLLEKRHLGLGWDTASGGERKKTLLTRAMLSRPQLLVLDEPFNHLDIASKTVVTTALCQYLAAEPEKRAMIIVSHEGDFQQEITKADLRLKLLELEPKR